MQKTIDVFDDEFGEQLKIDKNNLDEEVVRHPELFWHVSNSFALAVSRRDSLKDNSKRVHAETYGYLRAKMEKEDGKKPTEALLTAAVEAHPQYRSIRTEYMDAAKIAEQWLALKEAFQQRGWMIRELCNLHSANYYQNTSTTQQQYEQTRKEIAETRKNDRKKGKKKRQRVTG